MLLLTELVPCAVLLVWAALALPPVALLALLASLSILPPEPAPEPALVLMVLT